jgi:hypothetical protein
MLRLRTLLLVLTFGLGLTSSALADALVVVEVRGPDGSPVADGVVTLRPSAGGAPHSCRTNAAGTCRIADVPGGRYVVEFAPASGEAPAPRTAMIPPDGTVNLHVAAR